MHGREHTPADHATYATFWHCRLAQLNVVFISRAASGVVGVLRRFAQLSLHPT